MIIQLEETFMDWTQKHALDLLSKPDRIPENLGSFDSQHICVRIFALVTAYPKSKPTDVARMLDTTRHRVYAALPTMERLGLLLFEDDKGRLSVHSNQSDPDAIRALKCPY